MILTEDLNAALQSAPAAIAYRVSQAVAARHPGRAVVHLDGNLDVEGFADAGHCQLAVADGALPHFRDWFDEDLAVQRELDCGAYRATWKGETLELVVADVILDGCSNEHWWIVGQTLEVARGFMRAVREWDSDAHAEVLVFNGAAFRRSARLHEQLASASLDDLVLAGNLARELRADVEQWKSARELYARHRLPWKRGLLLIGPPGNGKTHAVRALVNAAGLRCIYVRTFKAHSCDEPEGVRRVFERARQIAPCVLVMEDLDALVSEQHRSALLNELDGFASNEGILTIASTNHPELLDRSILDRPSRFDRKFHFALPAFAERRLYLQRWAASLTEEMRPTDGALELAAEKSQGFTFAYLKELGLGAMMRWIAEARSGAMDEVLLGVLANLRAEMSSAAVVLGPLPRDRERRIGVVVDEV